jgi:SAM-dependent methyltransferase
MNPKYEQFSPSVNVFAEVQDFYERYPYPPPVESLDKYRLLWQDQHKRRVDYHLFWPSKPYQENRTILIAGCGTSQAAKHAMRWPDAEVIGIDFSATSISSTQDLKRKYKLDNLQVFQLPIERVGELDMKFDQVVCS